MDEPTKEAIEEARCWRKEIGKGVLTDPRLTTLEEADLEIHRRTAVALAAVRQKARDDALETVRQCERRSGACVMVHSLLNPEHPNLCNEENCSSIRAMNRL